MIMGKVVWVLYVALHSIITCGICQNPPARLSTQSAANVGGRVYGGRQTLSAGKITPRVYFSKSSEQTTQPIQIQSEEDTGSGHVEIDYVQADKVGLCVNQNQWVNARCAPSECHNDTSCTGTKKCCPDRCRYTCQDPVNVTIAIGYNDFYLVGMEAEYHCNITTVHINARKPTVKWTYAGYDVTPTRQSRLQVKALQQVVSKYTSYTASITFKEILQSDAYKLLECIAHIDNVAIGGDELLVNVATPLIDVDMRKVPFGNSTSIACYSKGPFLKVWCKDGNILKSSPEAEILTISPNAQTLMLTNLRKTAVYGCGLYKTGTSNLKCTAFETVSVYSPEDQPCPQETIVTATDEIFWETTYPDETAKSLCPSGYTGRTTRACRRDENVGIWDDVDNSSCISSRLSEISDKVSLINSGLASNTLNTLLSEVSNETNVIRGKRQWKTGELTTSLQIIQTVASIAKDRNYNVSEQELQDFVNTVNNIVDPTTKDTWTTLADKKEPSIDVSAPTVMKVMTSFGHSAVKGLDVGSQKRVSKNNIVIEARRSNVQGDITFFGQDIEPQNDSGDYITLKKETISNSGLAENGSVDFVGVYYSTLSSYLPSMRKVTRDSNNSRIVNDAIMSFSLTSGPKKNLDPPIELSFHQQEISFLRTKCVFWDFEKNRDWSTEGCKLVSTVDNITICECNHLTNFAILMSPYNTGGIHHKVLGIISIIGCSISLAGVIITIFCYITVWRHVKSEKSWLLMNLCVTLSLALVVFLVGVEQTQNKLLCNVVSGLLHYLFLCVFFLMLAEGISVAVSVTNVFARRSKLKYLLPMAWGVPAVIVGITFGVGGLPGNKKFCWLSMDDRFQLLAFIIPALCVILANVIITVIVLRALFSTRAVMTKTQKEKIKTGLRSVAVLAPIFGLTWVFGVLSVNESTRLFQYLFVIFNSLQGLFIFIFHCLMNKTVRDAFCMKCPCTSNQQKGSLTSQTPISKKDSKPVSESPFQNNYNNLTFDTTNDVRGTTTSFSYLKNKDTVNSKGNENKDTDFSSEKPLSKIEENKKTKQDFSNNTLEITRL